MRHYSKILGLRAWGVVRRPVWATIVGLGALYSCLQLVAHYLAERLVGIFDALYPWWYVPITVIAVFVLLKAGYELWDEAEQERKKAQAQLRVVEQDRRNLEKKLEDAESKAGDGPRHDRLLAELERVRGERDKFEEKLTAREQNEPFRDALLKSEAKWEYIREVKLSEIKELKQRCLELADKLYRFLEERGHEEVDDLQDPEMQRRSDETVELYREHFMDKVKALRKDLGQYDLWGLGVIDLHERDMVENPTNYLNVRAIAEYLRTIGNRL